MKVFSVPIISRASGMRHKVSATVLLLSQVIDFNAKSVYNKLSIGPGEK
jgi:hypothetical protein